MRRAIAAIRPVVVLLRGAWLDFKLATINPMAPDMPRLLIERNEIERPTR